MADQSRPDQITSTGYMNPQTWAHYTYDKVPITHAVTIVGWDDSYSKENFGNPDPATGRGRSPATSLQGTVPGSSRTAWAPRMAGSPMRSPVAGE